MPLNLDVTVLLKARGLFGTRFLQKEGSFSENSIKSITEN